MNICVFGDSIAWGANDQENGGWVSIAKSQLFTEDRKRKIYNYSVSGYSTDNLMEVIKDCLDMHPSVDLVILAIGVNDSQLPIDTKESKIPIKRTKSNLQNLIATSRKYADKILVIGLSDINEEVLNPASWDETSTHCYSALEVHQYNQVLQEVAKKAGVSFCSLDGLLTNDDLDDGLHPNAEGHRKIAEKTMGFIKKEFCI